jgi:hypothetical protein
VESASLTLECDALSVDPLVFNRVEVLESIIYEPCTVTDFGVGCMIPGDPDSAASWSEYGTAKLSKFLAAW